MEVKMIDIKKIVTNPLQPRQEFNIDKLQELANSIREAELLQPIVVRKNNGGNFEIVCGERRYKAFQILKEPKIPAIIRNIKDDTDALEKSLIENVQRDDLTSVERENAVYELWQSGRYKTHKDLARKLGTGIAYLSNIIEAKEFRDKKKIPKEIPTYTIKETRGMDDSVREKVSKTIPTGKILSIVQKLKEFPEPKQQLEILEEYEEQEEQSREIFEDIVRKKKEIIDGQREPEHIIEIESDSDKRMLEGYYNIKNHVFEIYSDHIRQFKSEKAKQEAIQTLWDIHNYTRKQLVNLGEIQEMEA